MTDKASISYNKNGDRPGLDGSNMTNHPSDNPCVGPDDALTGCFGESEFE